MLNFIIAVINQTYDEVKNDQVLINYAYKAVINLECQEIRSMFFKRKELSIILFSVNT